MYNDYTVDILMNNYTITFIITFKRRQPVIWCASIDIQCKLSIFQTPFNLVFIARKCIFNPLPKMCMWITVP